MKSMKDCEKLLYGDSRKEDLADPLGEIRVFNVHTFEPKYKLKQLLTKLQPCKVFGNAKEKAFFSSI